MEEIKMMLFSLIKNKETKGIQDFKKAGKNLLRRIHTGGSDLGLQCEASLVTFSVWFPFERREETKAIQTASLLLALKAII